MTEFAHNIKLTSEGYYDFPSDRMIRDMLWPDNYVDHPAKYSCHLANAVINYLTKLDDTVLDPMSGTGTTLIGALGHRNIICIELIEKYHLMQQEVVKKIEMIPDAGNTMLLLGDCNSYLPIPADLILFSPPYPTVTMGKYNTAKDHGEDFTDYKDNKFNAGTSSEFLYWHRMERIYKKLVDCAPTMAYTMRDSIKSGVRTDYVDHSVKLCEEVGWKLVENIYTKAYFTAFSAANSSKGIDIVKDESVLIFKRG